MPEVSQEYAVSKSKEFFEGLTWDQLKEGNRHSAKDSRTKVAIAEILDHVGSQLKEKLGVTTKDFYYLLILAGVSSLAAIKDSEEIDQSQNN